VAFETLSPIKLDPSRRRDGNSETEKLALTLSYQRKRCNKNERREFKGLGKNCLHSVNCINRVACLENLHEINFRSESIGQLLNGGSSESSDNFN
jgi:hypothetical protein